MERISTMFHEDLITIISASTDPFSLILDGSTDISNTHFLATHLQFYDHGVINTAFYKLIYLKDESAEGHVKAVREEYF